MALSLVFLVPAFFPVAAQEAQPNIILIYTDDQGYNDLGCYGSAKIDTLRIDQMAAEGMKLTSYYSAAPVCGPSRAGVMTGRHPKRVEELNGGKNYHTILAASEITIAEHLKGAGYATKAIGKWHLAGSGSGAIGTDSSQTGLDRYFAKNPTLMPTAQGFDEYFGIPYSNDMNPSVLMRDTTFIEAPVDQTTVTRRYADEAIAFIEARYERGPFFIYLAHSMPHTPLWTEPAFDGVSDYGPYGDCVEEIDYHTGRILDKLKELGIDDNTLVVFTSDNGPWAYVDPFPNADAGRTPDNENRNKQSGTADPLRGAKMTSFEGGHRVPCVVWWPGTVPAGAVENRIVTSLDFFPTFAALAGVPLPTDRTIDGRDAMAVLDGSDPTPLHEAFYYYKHTYLLGVRSGKWKLMLPRPAYPGNLGWYGRFQFEIVAPELYDLETDPGETTNVADTHPDVVAALQAYAAAARADLGDANPYATNPPDPPGGGEDPIGGTGKLILDLNADRGVTIDGGVSAWANQAAEGGDDLAQPDPAKRPVRLANAVNGHAAITLEGTAKNLIGDDASAFTSLIAGNGYTWMAVVRVPDQTLGNTTNNKFSLFGTLEDANPYAGVCGGVNGLERAMSLTRPGSNEVLSTGTSVLSDGQFHILAGRLTAGTGSRVCEVFVDSPTVQGTANVTISDTSSTGPIALGMERTGSNGGQAFAGDLVRLLIYDYPLSNIELGQIGFGLAEHYGLATSFPEPDTSMMPLSIEGFDGSSLSLGVEAIPAGLTFHMRKSSDLIVFEPLSPPLDFDYSSPQPLVIPIDLGSEPRMFFQVYSGPSGSL